MRSVVKVWVSVRDGKGVLWHGETTLPWQISKRTLLRRQSARTMGAVWDALIMRFLDTFAVEEAYMEVRDVSTLVAGNGNPCDASGGVGQPWKWATCPHDGGKGVTNG